MRRSQKDLEGRKKLIVLEGRKFCKRAYKERPWNTGYRFTWAGRRDSKRREKVVEIKARQGLDYRLINKIMCSLGGV